MGEVFPPEIVLKIIQLEERGLLWFLPIQIGSFFTLTSIRYLEK